MRSMFLAFISIFLSVYGLINFYVFIRGFQAIAQGSTLRAVYAIAFWIVALCFWGGRYLENAWPSGFSQFLVWVGSFWIAAMFYFFFAVVLLDLLRLINRFFPFFPEFIAGNYGRAKATAAIVVIALVAATLLGGYINSLFPRIRTLDLVIQKSAGDMKNINIVAASDIHLGTIVGRERFNRMVDKINGLHPDVVLFSGDIVDEDLAPVVRQNLGETLRSITPRFGVFAVTGNHEYIGGVEQACAYLSEHNVVMLRDRAIKVNNSFFLIGREDASSRRFANRERKTLAELMAGVDKTYPVVLLDHQPVQLAGSVREGVDLQLSGHTHNGQLWPFNYVVKALFEVACGYKKLGKTHVYVSLGVGTWGPPVRIGHRPEIVHIRLRIESPEH
jgi:predicted MPP superfamily phosphohydrolase